MDGCPSTFALDDAEIHGGPAAMTIAQHLDECLPCRKRRAQRDEYGRRFDSALGPPLWSRIDVARRGQHRRWIRPFGLAAPLLAAVAVAVLVVGRSPDVYRATKGDLAIEIAARRADAVFVVDPGTDVRAGDELQFTVRDARAAGHYVLVGSVDGTGKFSPFYPGSVDGHSVPLPPPGAPLAPPVVLDEAPGPERIVVVLSEHPIEVRVLVPMAESGASTPDLVAAITDAGGGAATARWIVVEKRERRRQRDEP